MRLSDADTDTDTDVDMMMSFVSDDDVDACNNNIRVLVGVQLAWSNSSVKWDLDSLLHSLSCVCWDIISAMASGAAAPAEPGASQPRIESENEEWDASTSARSKRRRLNLGDEEDVKKYGRLESSNREVVSGNIADLKRRKSILQETLHALGTPNKRHYYHDLAERNLQRWKEQWTEAATDLLAPKCSSTMEIGAR